MVFAFQSFPCTMEKFILSGIQFSPPCHQIQITIPSAKKYETVAVKNAETTIFPHELVIEAVKRRKMFDKHREKGQCHVEPKLFIDDHFVNLPKTLQHLLAPHPFPLSQGPVILPLELEVDPSASLDQLLASKTMFSHPRDQSCGLWVPNVFGLAAWTTENSFSIYEQSEVSSIVGVSSLRDMSVVYTCTNQSCVIKCPCHVCRAPRGDCCQSKQSRLDCKMCSPQCSLHQISVPYMFNPSQNLYTIFTENITKYRYAHGYAGIPKSCEHCVSDLLEHQVLHLVIHEFCRYCRFESRPLEFKKASRSMKKFIQAEKETHFLDESTCSFCLLQFKDKRGRKVHEEVVHRQVGQKFKCEQCTKSFVCQSSLDYHLRKHQNPDTVENHTCDLCGKKFTTQTSLKRHRSTIHKGTEDDSASFNCRECGKMLDSLQTLRRHTKELHYDARFNYDFHEGYKSPNIFECEECDQTFKRAEHLRRHVSHVHQDKQSLKCPLCEKGFGRPDNLKRHLKNSHGRDKN